MISDCDKCAVYLISICFPLLNHLKRVNLLTGDDEMDKEKAWRKFSQSGTVNDYLQFRNCVIGASEVKQIENEYRRSGAEGNRHGGK